MYETIRETEGDVWSVTCLGPTPFQYLILDRSHHAICSDFESCENNNLLLIFSC